MSRVVVSSPPKRRQSLVVDQILVEFMVERTVLVHVGIEKFNDLIDRCNDLCHATHCSKELVRFVSVAPKELDVGLDAKTFPLGATVGGSPSLGSRCHLGAHVLAEKRHAVDLLLRQMQRAKRRYIHR